MKKVYLGAAMLIVFAAAPSLAGPGAVAELFERFRAEGAGDFSAERGREMFYKTFKSAEDGSDRSCVTCHTENLRQVGKHAKTGEPIEPLAPSANPKRLTDTRHVRKWFLRNCKWTLGRECGPQEKGDLLMFFKDQ
ncbi:MAG: DUF1924 domain-containing protein [Candidatus Nitrospinota bacterium M3_3B_026]